jgi:hypothetical protein
MNWYYAVGGQQKGPVSEAELEALFKAGVIDASTLVWREGMANWQPYGQVKPSPMTPPLTSGGGMVCSQCGQTFSPDQLLTLNGVWVCAGCKPILLQRIREGVAPGGTAGRRSLPVNPDSLIEEIRQRDYDINIGSCITRSWEIVKSNPGLTIGTTLLATLCTQAPSMIPILGVILCLIIQGPMMAGLYIFCLKLIRGESAVLGDAFCGFSKDFGRFVWGMIFMSLLVYVWFIPGGIAMLALKNGNQPSWIALGLLMAAIIPVVYLAICCTFMIPLMADLGLKAGEAFKVSRQVVTMHWGKVFVLMLAGGLLMVLGMLACCVGLLVAMPLFYLMVAFAYEDIFSPRS